ncbi:MAG: N-acetylmuramoyl-L-alanine amidase [candidate division KSB1 bacterium]|nr:N-acetylmuramoyl-L-alanine amidase [candidate division KSB1 bacterium]MDZ7274800.1 N-acetylmuramoyl-L-alanine amidase [candidate division KSB1 bacterium]MDZ7285625.1 N-acetylmuramoyl-L-alanine amidase [candidate division KSB1 bacterium]MDZ7298657.1 N-acetylmuramoyl-L-alanine amidase [candidate division KSB1 bacterium]MDZ7307497.1 N-acetylmuramoyl-L-alanine amidase [candidate division KSB1 bacterium]
MKRFQECHAPVSPLVRTLVLAGIVAPALLNLAGCLKPYPRLPQSRTPQADSLQVAAVADRVAATESPEALPSKPDTLLPETLPGEDQIVAQFKDNRVFVLVRVNAAAGWHAALADRILYDPAAWQTISPVLAHTDSGDFVEVPFALLNYEYKKKALQQIFPASSENEEGWLHVVHYKGETLWAIAEIFTGEGRNYTALEKENNLAPHTPLRRGQRLRIPTSLLAKSLRNTSFPEFVALPQDTVAASVSPARAAEPPVSRDPALQFRKIAGEWFGIYRLQRGEALYSAVVVRFTGRVDADEVNQIARQLMRVNGIRDETAIPAGTAIRIPLRLVDEALLIKGGQEPGPQLPRRPGKLHVILDAGHGGNDPGTMVRGWREADLAYDLMRRLQRELEAAGVVVHPLVGSRARATASGNGGSDQRHNYVLVTPPYFIEDSRVALNLRINLIDAIYERLLRAGVPRANMILISIHLDHLHPALNGAMVYYPGARERLESYGAWWDGVYDRYVESRNRTISYTARDNQEAEAASENFARGLIAALRRARLPVHTYEPIRQYVYRGGRKWTPGIIRYSRVPTSVLLEAANLANPGDLMNMRASQFRQRFVAAVAQAIVEGK